MSEFVATWGPTITLSTGIIAFLLARMGEIRELRKDRRDALKQR